MKKVILILVTVIFLTACLKDDDGPRFNLEFLPIDTYVTPDSLTFGEIDTISITYTLKNGCYSFNDLYYEAKDTTRIVAVRAAVQLNVSCTEVAVQEEYKFRVLASQTEDYVFRFFKGYDTDGVSTFEEVVVPVRK